MRDRWFGTLCVLFLLLGLAGTVGAQEGGEQGPTEFDTYWMVFLERGENPPKLEAEAAADLQRQHLGHLGKVWQEGYALVAGPFEVSAEEPMRGIVLFRGDLEREKVVELASADPAVQAGLLQVRVFKWWTGADMLEFKAPPAVGE